MCVRKKISASPTRLAVFHLIITRPGFVDLCVATGDQTMTDMQLKCSKRTWLEDGTISSPTNSKALCLQPQSDQLLYNRIHNKKN